MASTNHPKGFYFQLSDFQLLDEASKYLHGYKLHRCFHEYLVLINHNWAKWIERGIFGLDGNLTTKGKYAPLHIDIDLDEIYFLKQMCAAYFYVLAGHKKANFFLINEEKNKKILYLRGYDYEIAYSQGHRIALGSSTYDTSLFTSILEKHLCKEFEVFKILSPRDINREIVPMDRYSENYEKIIQDASAPIRSLYLNAKEWRDEMEQLVKRIDYFVVYVSTITESVLWELELLDKRNRNLAVTVVLDENAINKKKGFGNLFDGLSQKFGGRSIWSINKRKEAITDIEAFKSLLAKKFHVVSPEQFVDNISIEKKRIYEVQDQTDLSFDKSPINFRFYPAMDNERLNELSKWNEAFAKLIHNQVAENKISNLQWFYNLLRLQKFTSLILGKQVETGRTLAQYAALMKAMIDLFIKTKRAIKKSSPNHSLKPEEELDQRVELLKNHHNWSRKISMTFLRSRDNYDPAGNLEYATQEYDKTFKESCESINFFFDEMAKRQFSQSDQSPYKDKT